MHILLKSLLGQNLPAWNSSSSSTKLQFTAIHPSQGAMEMWIPATTYCEYVKRRVISINWTAGGFSFYHVLLPFCKNHNQHHVNEFLDPEEILEITQVLCILSNQSLYKTWSIFSETTPHQLPPIKLLHI